MTATGRYTGRRLGKGIDEIRLLQLDDAKSWHIVIFALEAAPPYIILSYAWKEITDHLVRGNMKLQIFYQGDRYEHQVAPNLWQFMQRAEQQLRSRTYIWIDALCIDQEHVPERNHQVGIMSKIYRRASEMIIWLGETVEEDLTAVKTLTWLRPYTYQEYRRIDATSIWYKDFPQLGTDSIRGNVSDMQHLEAIKSNVDAISKAVHRICQRSYWSRLWIVQEFMLGAKIVIWFGGFSTDLYQFLLAVYTLVHIEDHLSPEHHFCPPTWLDAVARAGSQYTGLASFTQLCLSRGRFDSLDFLPSFEDIFLNSWHERGHSEIRDCVYALCGLTREQLRPQYTRPVTDLLFEVLCFESNKRSISLKRTLSKALAIDPGLALPAGQPDLSRRFRCQVDPMIVSKQGLQWQVEPEYPLNNGLQMCPCVVDRNPFDGGCSETFNALVVSKADFDPSKVFYHVIDSPLLIIARSDSVEDTVDDIAVLVSLSNEEHFQSIVDKITVKADAIGELLFTLTDMLCGQNAFEIHRFHTNFNDSVFCCYLDAKMLSATTSPKTYEGTMEVVAQDPVFDVTTTFWDVHGRGSDEVTNDVVEATQDLSVPANTQPAPKEQSRSHRLAQSVVQSRSRRSFLRRVASCFCG